MSPEREAQLEKARAIEQIAECAQSVIRRHESGWIFLSPLEFDVVQATADRMQAFADLAREDT